MLWMMSKSRKYLMIDSYYFTYYCIKGYGLELSNYIHKNLLINGVRYDFYYTDFINNPYRDHGSNENGYRNCGGVLPLYDPIQQLESYCNFYGHAYIELHGSCTRGFEVDTVTAWLQKNLSFNNDDYVSYDCKNN